MADVTVTFSEEMVIPADGSGVSLTDDAGNSLGVVSVAQGSTLEKLVYSGTWTPADPVPGVDTVSINYDALAGDLESLVGYPVGTFSGTVSACGSATDLVLLAQVPIDTIAVSWTESLYDPTVTYELFRNGVSVQTFAYGTDSYDDTGLTADTYYSYELHTLYSGNSIGSITAWTRTFATGYIAGSIYSGTKDTTTAWLVEKLATGVNIVKIENQTVQMLIGFTDDPLVEPTNWVNYGTVSPTYIRTLGAYVGWYSVGTGTFDLEQSVAK